MRRLILAALLLLGPASMASAEYVVIIVNLGGAGTTTPSPAPGPVGAQVGAQAGFPFPPANVGAQAGFPKPPANVGAQAGFPFPPANVGAQAGFPMPPANVGAQAGFPFPPANVGAQAGFPFPPANVGAQAGFPFPPANVGAQAGFPKMPANVGAQAGFPPGFQAGLQVGVPRPVPVALDVDTEKRLVVVVLEVEPITKDYLTKFEGKTFKSGHRVAPAPIKVQHKWGVVDLVKGDGSSSQIIFLKADGKPLATVATRFHKQYDEAIKGSAEDLRKLALWALQHGMVDKCAEVLDKLAEKDRAAPASKAYLEVKANLAKVPAGNGKADRVRGKLLDGYKITTTDKHHYAVVHNDSVGEVKPQLDRLEASFRGFYYWWAIRGVALKVPAERQVAVLSDRKEDLARLKKHVGTSPTLADGFFARREALPVLSASRTDDPYQGLSGSSRPYWELGFDRVALLTGRAKAGIPAGQNEAAAKSPRLRALLLKALEEEWEATGISHETARQLLFTTGMLPSNVTVPEWAQSGMGSFFEVPLQSPWPGIGSCSTYWLPRVQELMEKRRLGTTATEALVQVVTDGYFRKATGKGGTSDDLRKARATAWALTYFLAQERLPQLQNYYKELSKMPRDIELDDKVLLTCFARAFGCVNPDRSIDREGLERLATSWQNYTRALRLEAPSLHKDIRDAYEQMARSGRPAGGVNPGGVVPRPPVPGGGIRPGGGIVPGGGVRPGGGIVPGGGIRPGGRPGRG